MPPTRNAIDSTLAGWSGGKHPMTGWIEPYSCKCTNGTEAECNSGQSCFWFSHGCTIQCDKCDGKHATSKCPYFKQARDKHKDAWDAYAGDEGAGGGRRW